MAGKSLTGLFRDNGLSIVLFSLFAIFLIGQALSGWLHENEERIEHRQPPVTLTSYLASGSFGEAVFENWESEFLQMGLYVILTVFLFQRGSSESRDPDKKEPVDADPSLASHRADVPLPVKKGGWRLALYNHSLFLVFALLFLVSFFGHALCGLSAFNEEAARHARPALDLCGYISSSQFWFESFQNWQSEFLAIFSLVILSIWLRQKGSPESKPVAAPHAATGG